MELKKYKLGDIAKIEISGVDKKSVDGETPVRLCNFVDVYRNWAITQKLSENFMIASAKETEIAKCSIHKGQVAITKDSETRDDIGIPAYIADDFDNVLLGYHCALITPNDDVLDGKYLNAFMHTRYIQKYFENNASGSGQRYTLSNETIFQIPILLPSLEVQKAIGNLLSNIDRKIELNHQINDNLEQQAQALFKAWFVDNAVIGDASVSDYFIPLRGKNLLTSDAKGGEVPVVAGGLTPSAYHNVANTKAPVITISASGANAGYVNLWGIPVWSADSSYIDSSITPHIYFWYNLLKFSQKNIFDSQTGSAQPHIYPKHIGDIRIPDLDLDKVADYNKIVTPIYEQITNTKKINAQLAETRDTLLPKLMSGELKIGKVEM